MNFSLIFESFLKILNGLALSLEIIVLSLILGFLASILIVLMRLSKNILFSRFSRGFIFSIRGTPLLVQIYFIYYGLAQFSFIRDSFLWIILKEPFWCGVIALTINTSAYTAEIIRSGLNAISKGQIESATAFGMTKFQTFKRILIPQALRQSIPAYSNEIILMIKSSSLVSIITIMEMTGIARKIISTTFAPIEVFIAAGIIYLFLNYLITIIFRQVEKRYSVSY
ncbi:MAG: ABC transporter permease [Pelagibacteraceae bacterium]|nr:ABC transporter permease [Pelagibacteraceae bacterium]|tara:strand:- start:723 stop:1400 length:678 start_codon:yes stop_codon:yes gene_type:complete